MLLPHNSIKKLVNYQTDDLFYKYLVRRDETLRQNERFIISPRGERKCDRCQKNLKKPGTVPGTGTSMY
jgi:hypothetical protein